VRSHLVTAAFAFAAAACSTVVPTPVPATPTATQTVSATVSATPALCQAEDLDATAWWQGATGSVAGAIDLTGVGGRACLVDGPPTLVRLWSGDVALDVVVYRPVDLVGPEGSPTAGPVVLRPGGRASAFLIWSDWCAVMLPQITEVEITLSGGATLRAHSPPPTPGIIGQPGLDGPPRCDQPGARSVLTVWAFAALQG